MAIMVGTDFNQGIKGIGAKKGLKLIKKYGDIYHILDSLNIQLDVDAQILREMFLNHEVDSNYQLKWEKQINKVLLIFSGEHDFSEDRVLNAVDKLKN